MIKRLRDKRHNKARAREPFKVIEPKELGGPVVFASPHSGRFYPPDLRKLSILDGRSLRRSEDGYVDRLLERVPLAGLPVLKAVYGRAYVDLNRSPDELDPAMFDDLPMSLHVQPSDRVVAGFGVVPRMVANGLAIFEGRLPFAEAQARLRVVHEPYHVALEALMQAAEARYGFAVLVDCHSMPSRQAILDEGMKGRRSSEIVEPDIVLGDRFGASCDGRLRTAVARHFRERGFRVIRNQPYAGGYCTETHGRPTEGRHAIQLEINRRLYLREASGRLRAKGTRQLQECLGELATNLKGLDLSARLPLAAE
jgi:N-formylglutamate amidohydrolase